MPTAQLVRQQGFGLVFASDRAIPGLAPAPASAAAAIRVHLQRLPESLPRAERRLLHPPPGTDSALALSALDDGALLLEYADGTCFVVDRGGTELWATWAPEATLEDTATYLLGPVAALLLRLRRLVPLHASAVLVDGGAVAFAGPGGAGKSTLAAAFARIGRRVIADDVLALDGEALVVHPAYPRIRLWPDSAEALFAEPLPPLTPGWEKRFLDLSGEAFPAHPFPLRAVYLLEERAERPAIRPLSPREGLLALVPATCATFFPQAEARQREFLVLARLAREVPIRALRATDDPLALAALCEVIEAHVRAGAT